MAKKLLIVGFVWPEPKSSAAGSRMMQLIHAFKTNGYHITFASPCSKTNNAFNLESIGVLETKIELNHKSFDVFIKEFDPSIVLFDRFNMEEQFGWRVAEHCPNALRILDTEDLHGLRKGRQQAFKDVKPFDKHYLFNDFSKREIASIYRSDLSLIISEVEMDILQTQFKVDKQLLYYLPFMLEEISKEAFEGLPKFEERQYFITIGNFLHEPNYNSVLYLKEIIWPMIRKKISKAEMHVYGAYPNEKAKQLHQKKEGFLIKGFAADVNQVMQNTKVCLAPLRFGAGLKGKVIDAMQNGTPCVMTSIASEGIFGTNEPTEITGFIEDVAEAFANKAVALYTNKLLWKEKQYKGIDVINKRFNKKLLEPNFIKVVEALKTNLEAHRLENFTGTMLQFHTLQSTKFMSKWIEEKNRE